MESDLDAPDLRGRANNHQNNQYDLHHDQSESPQYSQSHFHSAFDTPYQQLDLSLTVPLQASNHEAAFSNLQQHALNPVNPDDFYKSFHDPRFNHPDPESLPMASTSSVSRPNLRSNGDGSTPKHPTVSTNRSLPRPTKVRSVSNPAEGTQPTSTRQVAKGKTSVKDLRRRFDQNNTQSAIPRAPAQPGTATRVKRDGPVPSTSSTRDTPSSYAALRTGGEQGMANESKNASTSSRSNRSKFVAEDQVSSNSQSFASRVGKPRGPAGASSNTSRTVPTHISPQSPKNPPVSLAPPADLPPQGLLFGEILPDQWDTAALGFGIEDIRPNAADESNVQAHQRSLSDPDVEPSSPSHWYRDTDLRNNEGQAQEPTRGRHHGRSLSDAPSQKPPKTISRKPATRKSNQATTSPVPPSSSKLPLSVRKLNSPTGSSSTPSTRSNSPAAAKRKQPNGVHSRAKNPASGTKTPTGGRKAAPPGLLTPDSSNRLQAYIATPPPKLSPPLRSSRPRQPVSAATTASSRMKAADRSKANNSASSSSSKANEQTTRRRKISIGPIDFEQRREHIRLAYSKSVRESQALEARQKAAERRRRDIEDATKAKAAAEAAVAAEAARAQESQRETDKATAESECDHDANSPARFIDMPITIDASSPTDVSWRNETESVTSPEAPTLTITTSKETEAPILDVAKDKHDSPTLGLPGSFPSFSPPIGYDEPPPPQSAISMTSGITEFDNEPQINSPIPAEPAVDIPIAIVKPPNPEPALATTPRAEYHYPFEDEPMSSPDARGVQDLTTDDTEPRDSNKFYESEIPVQLEDSCDEGGSTTADDVFGAKVTILPPRDSEQAGDVNHQSMVPFPRIDMSDELSDCQSVYEAEPESRHPLHYAHHEDEDTDACTEDSVDLDKSEDCQSESRCGDQESSYRASSCASSEAGEDDRQQYTDSVGVTSNHLMVPSMKANRISQQSAWTDFSVDSGHSDVTRTPDLYDEEPTESFGHVTIFESRVISRDSDPAPPEINDTASSVRSSCDSSQPRFLDQHELPNGEAGDSFDIPYLSRRGYSSSSFAPSPHYEPPPIPTGDSASINIDSRRASSAYYAQSQRGSAFINSDRASEDFMSQLETPRTIDSNSISAKDYDFGAPSLGESDIKAVAQDGEELDDKERHRLVQRRNVIKELVDTEAVFVRDMNIVEEIYKGTAEACPRLDPQTVKLIFRNTDEIINFHTLFLGQLKEAVSAVYTPKTGRSIAPRDDGNNSESAQSGPIEISDAKDRTISLGPVFKANMEKMKSVHEAFLRSSDQAAKRLIQIQQDSTVKVWLNECNEVAKDLTAAWDLDSLLIKPMQRITKYPNLIITLLQHMPQDHPDREELLSAKDTLEIAIIDINKTKKNFELVGQIVGRKRKESDVKAGFARAFGKRVDKLQASGARPPEDPVYAKLNEKFGDDYLRLQVVLRDVEYYTRQVSTYVREFLQYLSSVELVMRLQPGSFPELESKWVQFNISIRDLEKVALDEHLVQVRKQVIEPFELMIKAYGNPSLAMKKRQKRRLDYERSEQLKRSGKSGDSKLLELVEQYEALNDTLVKELPKLSALTEKVGNICLGNFVNIQASWYSIWCDKMRTVLSDSAEIPDLKDIVSTFEQDFPFAQEQVASIGILNPAPRASQSTTVSNDDASARSRHRPSDVDIARSRALSSEDAPTLPTPDFAKHMGGLVMPSSPPGSRGVPSPHQYYYRDFYAGIGTGPGSTASTPQLTQEVSSSSRSFAGTGATSTRPSTGKSFESASIPRYSSDQAAPQYKRDSNATFNSNHAQESRRFSGLFHSALPMPDGPEDSRRSSRASSRERQAANDGYNVLWLAASLFEFNIATTKHEAGYPYLVYQAGEIFDVIAEKGELWLAKNQDDPKDQVGWIWSKHFAKLADS